MTANKYTKLPHELGYTQPLSTLRLSTSSKNWWIQTIREYLNTNVRFTKRTLEHMSHLRKNFQPIDLFLKFNTHELILLMVELDRFSADESLIHFLISAFKLQVLNPTRRFTRLQLQGIMLDCASIAISQVVDAENIKNETDTHELFSASTVMILPQKFVPEVTQFLAAIFRLMFSFEVHRRKTTNPTLVRFQQQSFESFISVSIATDFNAEPTEMLYNNNWVRAMCNRNTLFFGLSDEVLSHFPPLVLKQIEHHLQANRPPTTVFTSETATSLIEQIKNLQPQKLPVLKMVKFGSKNIFLPHMC